MNSVRTPRVGVTAHSRRIAKAVDDEQWQLFRVAMKGVSTYAKLRMLDAWYETVAHSHSTYRQFVSNDCDTCIQIDNYLKALSRGGFIPKGTTLLSALPNRMKGVEVLKG